MADIWHTIQPQTSFNGSFVSIRLHCSVKKSTASQLPEKRCGAVSVSVNGLVANQAIGRRRAQCSLHVHQVVKSGTSIRREDDAVVPDVDLT